MGTSFEKDIEKFVNGYRAKKWERLFKMILRNSPMGTGQKMGASLQKDIEKFVNASRVKNGNVFSKRYY